MVVRDIGGPLLAGHRVRRGDNDLRGAKLDRDVDRLAPVARHVHRADPLARRVRRKVNMPEGRRVQLERDASLLVGHGSPAICCRLVARWELGSDLDEAAEDVVHVCAHVAWLELGIRGPVREMLAHIEQASP